MTRRAHAKRPSLHIVPSQPTTFERGSSSSELHISEDLQKIIDIFEWLQVCYFSSDSTTSSVRLSGSLEYNDDHRLGEGDNVTRISPVKPSDDIDTPIEHLTMDIFNPSLRLAMESLYSGHTIHTVARIAKRTSLPRPISGSIGVSFPVVYSLLYDNESKRYQIVQDKKHNSLSPEELNRVLDWLDHFFVDRGTTCKASLRSLALVHTIENQE